MRKKTIGFSKLILILYILFITSCAFFSKKNISEKNNIDILIKNDNESSYVLKDIFSIKEPIFKITVDSRLLSGPIMQESFASWINNFKTDFSKILETKNILDQSNNNKNYIIPELSIEPKAKELMDCDTYIPYLYKKCEKKYFIYINGNIILNFYKEYVPVKNEIIDFAKLGLPNIVEAASIEEINKKAVTLMGKVYKYLIDYLNKHNSIYYIGKKEEVNK
jgi:hypothetical protein